MPRYQILQESGQKLSNKQYEASEASNGYVVSDQYKLQEFV